MNLQFAIEIFDYCNFGVYFFLLTDIWEVWKSCEVSLNVY